MRISVIIAILIILSLACSLGETAPQFSKIGRQNGDLMQKPTLTKGATPEPPPSPSEVEETPTLETTLLGSPEITPTLLISGTLTPTVLIPEFPTITITSTNELTPTIVITAPTTILTQTWTITDVLVTQGGTIHKVAWKGGDLFAAATSVGLFLYDAFTLESGRDFYVGEPVLSVAFSPDEGLLVSGRMNGDIEWRDPENGKFIATMEGHRLGITDIAFPVRSHYMASGSDDGTVRTWIPAFVLNPGVTDYLPTNTWRAIDRVTSVDINQFVYLVVAGSYRTVSVWNLETGEFIQTLDEIAGWVNDLAMSSDGGKLAVADSSNHLKIWNTSNWELTHDIPLAQFKQISALDFSPDGTRLALGGSSGAVLLWDLVANSINDPIERYPYAVTDIAFHPFADILISGHENGTVRMWSFPP